MAEQWRPIENYKGLYEVSSLGRVRNSKLLILKQQINSSGYHWVSLSNGTSNVRHKFVHRMVAEAFVDNPDGLTDVNHEDGNKLNNTYNNLVWSTHSDNLRHAYRTGLHKGNGKNRSVAQLLNDKVIKTYESVRAAARALGMKDKGSRIVKCCNNHSYSSYGYKWRYVDEME